MRGRFFRRLDEGHPLAIGEVVHTEAFLPQAHDYLRNAHLGADAEQRPARLAQGAADR